MKNSVINLVEQQPLCIESVNTVIQQIVTAWLVRQLDGLRK